MINLYFADLKSLFKNANPRLVPTNTNGYYECYNPTQNKELIYSGNKYIYIYMNSSHCSTRINMQLCDTFEEPQESNSFVLKIKDYTIESIKKVLLTDSEIYPGMKIMDVLIKVDKILTRIYSANQYKNSIKESELKCLSDLIKVEDKILEDLFNDYNNEGLSILHKALFHDYDAELFSPLLSSSLMDQVTTGISQIYKVAESLNFANLASLSMEKYKKTISSQLNDINRLQEQLVTLNATVDNLNKQIKLKEATIAELAKQLTEVQTNPTNVTVRLQQTACCDCLENIKKRAEMEIKFQELKMKRSIES